MSVSVTLRKVSGQDQARLAMNPAAFRELADDEDMAEPLLLGESWEPIHAALTDGQPEGPLFQAVRGDGGVPVSEVDQGAGAGKLLDPAQVKAVAKALEEVDDAKLQEKLSDDDLDTYEALFEIYAEAAEEGAAMLFWFTND